MVRERLFNEIDCFIDALDVDESQLLQILHSLAVHDQMFDALLT